VENLGKSDVELAALKLNKDDLSLVIVKNGEVIFETKKAGIGGFLQAIEELDKELVSSSIADKVIGVAASTLCVYSGVVSVFAQTISEGGLEVLKNSNIECIFRTKVSSILNRDKTDVCPFEKLAIASETVQEAYLKLKSFADKLMKSQLNRVVTDFLVKKEKRVVWSDLFYPVGDGNSIGGPSGAIINMSISGAIF
jgi:hypothetical protein